MNGRTLLAVGLLLVAAISAGCFGPDEDPSTEVEGGEETTPGEETVEAGGVPQGEPANDTANVEGTTTGTAVNETDETEEDGEG